MASILHIETATEVCSVAVSTDSNVIFYKEDKDGPSHARLLGVFVQEALEMLKHKSIKLDAVAVSSGPGSYTGLRIGVSEAKGLCYGLGIPLIAIETLKIMAYRVATESDLDSAVILCPMIDARRMEVYDALYDFGLSKLRETSADIVDGETFSSFLSEGKVAFFGNGAAKCQTIIASSNAIMLSDIFPRAKDMVDLAMKAYAVQDFVDVAYYEPFYLKEFVGTIPKNKILPQ